MLTKNEFHYTIKEKGEEKLQEESIQKENSIKHVVTKDEVVAFFRQYLGSKHLAMLRTLKKDIKKYNLFCSLLPKIEETAYFVKGGETSLKQFRAFFIAKCVEKHYEYASFMLKNYISGLIDKADDEIFMSGAGKELLFLYLHGETPGVGNTDNWLCKSAIDKMVDRKRNGLITVLLSERDVPIVENSKEVTVINLGGAQKALAVEEVAASIKEGSSSESNSTVTYD